MWAVVVDASVVKPRRLGAKLEAAMGAEVVPARHLVEK